MKSDLSEQQRNSISEMRLYKHTVRDSSKPEMQYHHRIEQRNHTEGKNKIHIAMYKTGQSDSQLKSTFWMQVLTKDNRTNFVLRNQPQFKNRVEAVPEHGRSVIPRFCRVSELEVALIQRQNSFSPIPKSSHVPAQQDSRFSPSPKIQLRMTSVLFILTHLWSGATRNRKVRPPPATSLQFLLWGPASPSFCRLSVGVVRYFSWLQRCQRGAIFRSFFVYGGSHFQNFSTLCARVRTFGCTYPFNLWIHPCSVETAIQMSGPFDKHTWSF